MTSVFFADKDKVQSKEIILQILCRKADGKEPARVLDE